MCLPTGGPSNPPSPPANTDCPFNWSWNSGKGCCAPHQPPSTLPPPQCPKNWNWSSGSLCCNAPPTPPTTTKPPTPSKTPGKDGKDEDCDDDKGGNDGKGKGGGNGNNHNKRIDIKKREYRSRNVTPCPRGLSACPVSSLVGGDYECVDTLVDLDNCGGCATLGEGKNCNALPGVWNVGCEQSVCESESIVFLTLATDGLTFYEISLYVCGRLHSFQGRKVLQPSLDPPAVRSTHYEQPMIPLAATAAVTLFIPATLRAHPHSAFWIIFSTTRWTYLIHYIYHSLNTTALFRRSLRLVPPACLVRPCPLPRCRDAACRWTDAPCLLITMAASLLPFDLRLSSHDCVYVTMHSWCHVSVCNTCSTVREF